MPEYDNTNRGVLFKNERKVNERHPDYTGSINVTCDNCQHENDKRLAAWVKESRNGKTFVSLTVSEKKEYSQEPQDITAVEPTGEEPAAAKPKGQVDDVVIEDIGDEPINLDDIPF